MNWRSFVYVCLLVTSSCFVGCDSLQNLVKPLPKPTTTRRPTVPPSGTSSTTRLRQNIVDYALEQKGAKYTYAGRSPRTGFDCSGFTHYVFDEFNIDLTPVSRSQEVEGRRVDIDDAKTGDLIFFRKSRASSVFHVALVVKNDHTGLTVVHSTSSRGVISENISNSSYWAPKISTACDIIGKQ